MLKKLINILISLLTCLTVNGQTITERLILSDNKDSLYLNSSVISFDRQGNYCFVIKKNEQEFFVTNKDTFGGFKLIGSTYGKYGKINYTNSYSDPIDKPFTTKMQKEQKFMEHQLAKLKAIKPVIQMKILQLQQP